MRSHIERIPIAPALERVSVKRETIPSSLRIYYFTPSLFLARASMAREASARAAERGVVRERRFKPRNEN